MRRTHRFTGVAKTGFNGVCGCALTIFLSASALAEGSSGTEHGETLGGAHDAPAHHAGLGFPHHTLGVFFGDTTETRRFQGFTRGLEYEYRVNEQFGVGAIVEHVGGDFHTNVAVLPLAYHRGPWKLYAGPGIEGSEELGSAFLLRVGLEYGFHVGKYELSPQIDVDFIENEHLFIFGVTVARPF